MLSQIALDPNSKGNYIESVLPTYLKIHCQFQFHYS